MPEGMRGGLLGARAYVCAMAIFVAAASRGLPVSSFLARGLVSFRTLGLQCRSDIANGIVQASHLRLDNQAVAEAVLTVLVGILVAREPIPLDLTDEAIIQRAAGAQEAASRQQWALSKYEKPTSSHLHCANPGVSE